MQSLFYTQQFLMRSMQQYVFVMFSFCWKPMTVFGSLDLFHVV